MGWSGVQVTTLPPKWVQSTDLLGKDNLGRKVRGDKVTELARTPSPGCSLPQGWFTSLQSKAATA